MSDDGAAGVWSELGPISYTRRDVLLYAAGIGAGQGGKEKYDADLRYTCELPVTPSLVLWSGPTPPPPLLRLTRPPSLRWPCR